MTSGSDKVEQRVDTIVAESWVTLDTGLLCENIVVLSLEIANNFTEAVFVSKVHSSLRCPPYLASLSI